MSDEIKGSGPTDRDPNEDENQGSDPTGYEPSEVPQVIMLANVTLVGIPTAYAVSQSMIVTGLTALSTAALVMAYLLRRHRR